MQLRMSHKLSYPYIALKFARQACLSQVSRRLKISYPRHGHIYVDFGRDHCPAMEFGCKVYFVWFETSYHLTNHQ